ncbi:MAG: rRNA maturation RNase YbeY [Candidatus Magasanikbacteria bacterium RIFCSPLOWO2_01_FULL_43_20b]|uniref:Endoribonuclease YbeY n=1 Tax=Candidatus Magasanikbacteria bacterium RIFCSPLOWO2_12_FULL_43_12 TaxID=1798692 RepID=A0A1F6MQX2_9BACT|nr:MAG: rRNA maturation RNase YbeY [Candidatus Magasanikbacteria bacterium RIFCSPHIGHO2_02_FULL_44_13]OGH73449.1 MAG: rRNA maturation RNase YbeY [Candidatus Magasanikbacteria bacterium RIFCSPLOWO2_01_FULL_43_20b]OGH74075.1 MAG: rRNA maturation RNase YbeY [Candidatus Magasanikbacteria bacterium RIFCSPLOWO2_12_FULL_43_12]
MECLIYNKVKQSALTDAEIKRLAKKILSQFKSLAKNLSIQFVGEKKIRGLNKKYRGVDKVTDVLSFGLEGRDLGDIFICFSQIKKQAKIYQVEVKEELARMITHGVLHLLGFDHQKKVEERKMFLLQEKLIKKFL